ncbi:MAG: VCBS repeat-containing protein [Planctomycetota bacterium]
MKNRHHSIVLIPMTMLAATTVCLVGCADEPADETAANTNAATAETVSDTSTTVPVADDAAASSAPTAPSLSFTSSNAGLPVDKMWKCDPIFADFNGDGHMDMAAIPRLGTGVRAWAGDGTGNWTESSDGLKTEIRSCGGGIQFADVNGDDHLDLCVADHCQGVFVYLGNGAGAWTKVVDSMFAEELAPEGRVMLFQGAEDLATGDVDGDGDVDLVVGASDHGGFTLWLGDGTGVNWERSTSNGGLPANGWNPRSILHDMDGDGDLDLVSATFQGPRMYTNDGEGFFSERSVGLPQPTVQGIYNGIKVGDMNNDGRPDIVAANWFDGPEIYFQDANYRWRKATQDVFPDMVGGATGVAIGDIDGDSYPEIICTGRLERSAGLIRGVFALRNNGDETFTFLKDSGLPNTGLMAMSGVEMADFTNDGVLDIVACSGLAVETPLSPTNQPVIEARLMAWTTSRSHDAQEASVRALRPGDTKDQSELTATDTDGRPLASVPATAPDEGR